MVAGLVALPTLAHLLRNVASTYDRFPGLSRPWFAVDLDLAFWVQAGAVLVGLAAAVGMGLATAWLVRPRDAWADLSAGVTTALAATLSAFVSCVGFPVILALVVVPSLADLTLVCHSASTPAAEAGKTISHASAALAQRYADLAATEPERRGELFMSKIVSDQVSGSLSAVCVGVLVALLTAGSLALCGTFAAGFLLRRGQRLARVVVPYLEVTLPVTATLTLGVGTALSPVWSAFLGGELFAAGGLPLAALAGVTALMVVGVVRGWPWLLRLCLGLGWLVLLAQSRPGSSWVMTAAVVGVLGYLVLRFSSERTGSASLARP
jgi:hypothetical protein